LKLNDKVINIKGIGDKTAKLLTKLGIDTVGDLIRHYPVGYDVYEAAIPINEIEEGKVVTITGKIAGNILISGNSSMQVTTATLQDVSGTIKVIWFRSPFLRSSLANAQRGDEITLRGQALKKGNALVLQHPEIFNPSNTYEKKLNSLQPRYRLTTGLSNNLVIKAVHQAISELPLEKDTLPEEIRKEFSLAEYNFAINGIHFPTSKDVFFHARERLVFEEFLIFLLQIRALKEEQVTLSNGYLVSREVRQQIADLIKNLPYELTKAQGNVIIDSLADMSSEKVMSRLVQGDVGSGKTIVAVMLMIAVVLSGYQSAIMAPTEVLARQHFESISYIVAGFELDIQCELLVGSMTAKEKREAYERVAEGKSGIVIGTHAVIQDKVVFKDLALVVTDEQHRFGVKQRETFAKKGNMPHMLVMSATPIPRTLAMILYGDLDVSVIDELPANRIPIKNCVVDTSYRPTAYKFIEKQVKDNHQCYIICPMVEESDVLDAENVIDYSKNIQQILGEDIKVSHLHGKMKAQQKEEIMQAFAKNETQVLVSTTVIEVGIDVPNATVMMIENAERFGLAQLHQLRGRVGRGAYESFCIFMSGNKSKETRERLEILNSSNDGFFIASEDLRLRGPGDLFGIRQSGLLEFKLADVFQDAKILQNASEVAKRLDKEQSGKLLEQFEPNEINIVTL
jgi:ATP-dependent DNA helicase RecG